MLAKAKKPPREPQAIIANPSIKTQATNAIYLVLDISSRSESIICMSRLKTIHICMTSSPEFASQPEPTAAPYLSYSKPLATQLSATL